MTVTIGSARIDERCKISGGKLGDQNGQEVKFQNWYKHPNGWKVLRAKDSNVALRLARAMRAACINDRIGYDQSKRSTLYNAVKDKGFDPEKCNIDVATDCSALVRVCCCYALQKPLADFNVGGMKAVLMPTGKFAELTGSQYSDRSDLLQVGDILYTKGHTVIVTNVTGTATKATTKSSGIKVAPYTLKKNNKGATVKTLQENLNRVMNAGLKVDGSFGITTENAVKEFQKKYGLVVDGVYGKNCYNKMKSVLK